MYNEQYREYQLRKKSRLRRFIRELYLQNVLRYIQGYAIDFGCGAGELLEKLPEGSLGYDVNPAIVEYCRGKGLNVIKYNPDIDNYRFNDCTGNQYNTFIMCHVLEHIEEPDRALELIIKACAKLCIGRIIITVPGKKGFRKDKTHRVFIDRSFFENNNLLRAVKDSGYEITRLKYFPFPSRLAGNFFVYNELIVVIDRI